VSVSTHIKVAPRTDTGLSAGKRAHPVRGLFDDVNRWGSVGFRHVRHSRYECTHPVDAGSYVTERSGAALSAGVSGKTIRNPCHAVPRCRCLVGDGRRVALHIAGCCDWRNLGRAARARFYRDQTAGNPSRGQPSALLADPPGGQPGSECSAKPLANCLSAVAAASPRSDGTRRSALAGRTVPLASRTARNLGGKP
jgi:hypothetical protein